MPTPGYPATAGFPVSGASTAAPTSSPTPIPGVAASPMPIINPGGSSPQEQTVQPGTITNNQGQQVPNPALSSNNPADTFSNPQGTSSSSTFTQPANPGQIDPTTLMQTMAQLYDPNQLVSYAQQGEAAQSALKQENLQTNEQVAADQLQSQLYGLQGQQSQTNLGYSLGQLGLQTQGENQSYAQALQSLQSQLGSAGMAASGQAGQQQGWLAATHARNLAGFGISAEQAQSENAYTQQQVGLEEQQQGLQANLAKALYSGDITSAGQLMNLLGAGATMTQVQNMIAGAPDLGLALGPGVPTGTAQKEESAYNSAVGNLNTTVNSVLGLPASSGG